ncbi:CHAD domain-containing protein [Kitasatospora sp. MAP5-34]|uniref:CHAD domain-containing protein n=1 Tax=Kitasatospora sp. MAP5-34 TaxID=3035102 RepID=UPI002473914D|nr:CHAD domain-containing protein [Kitasatospora sp. MAP5-34]MDH6577827.1 CHAD domain-containing protein [Kitasatospora sp. MAP5-34]
MAQQAGRTAGALLAARIAEQAAVLAGLEAAVRADEPDAVHRMRVASRRLRSALRAYGPPLREVVGELRWLASVLGLARDSEVLGARLLAQAGALPPECGRDELVTRLTRWSRELSERARPEVQAALDGPRYAALLARLAAEPPPGDGLPALSELARREQRRVAARLKAAVGGPDGDRELHEARKAAKWARYLGETAGLPADGFTARMKALQELLGEHQDSVVARAALLGLARDHPEEGFGYGVLYGGQLAVAERVRERLPDVRRRLRKAATWE